MNDEKELKTPVTIDGYTGPEAFIWLKGEFESRRDPADAAAMTVYMRDQFKFYGLKTPIRKAVYKEFLKAEKKKKAVDWALLERCYKDEHREFHYFALDYLEAMRKFLVFDDVPRLEKFARARQWWDTIDKLDRIIGGIGLTDSRINDLMLRWSEDEDFWIRRIAIDHQLGRKEKTDTALLETILINNFGSSEFFINKSIGWSLREYSKTDPDWVRAFVEAHRDEMSGLSLREASKYI